jgi:mono/diheme cytochrome c family protein
MSDDMFGLLVARNITRGTGGVPANYTDTDWVRAIRHGVSTDGKPLVVMPSTDWWHLSDEDLGQIVAYVKAQPPVDNELPDISIKPVGAVFALLGQLPGVLPAEDIDHATRPPAPPRGVTAEYGGYMAFSCEICHGPDLSGGPNASGGLNITPGGDIGEWTQEQFFTALRTGVRPDGEELDENEMPWRTIAKLTDDELTALWLYLRSIPAVETPPDQRSQP